MKLLPCDSLSLWHKRTTTCMIISGDYALPQENKDLSITVPTGLSQIHWHHEYILESKETCPWVCSPQEVMETCLLDHLCLGDGWQSVPTANPGAPEVLERCCDAPLSPGSHTEYSLLSLTSLPKLRPHQCLCMPRCPLSDSSNLGTLTFILPSAA